MLLPLPYSKASINRHGSAQRQASRFIDSVALLALLLHDGGRVVAAVARSGGRLALASVAVLPCRNCLPSSSRCNMDGCHPVPDAFEDDSCEQVLQAVALVMFTHDRVRHHRFRRTTRARFGISSAFGRHLAGDQVRSSL